MTLTDASQAPSPQPGENLDSVSIAGIPLRPTSMKLGVELVTRASSMLSELGILECFRI